MHVDRDHDVPLLAAALSNPKDGFIITPSSRVLDQRVQSVSEALERVAAVQQAFEREYGNMVETVVERHLPTAVCTIYDPRYPEPMRSTGRVALSAFNDCITRQAFNNGLDVIDLRLVCDQDV